MNNAEFNLDIQCCARCGEDHMGLPVYRFVGAAPLPRTHYTQCPVTMQPVLVSIREVDVVSVDVRDTLMEAGFPSADVVESDGEQAAHQ